jgi:hypothetical protein
MEVQTSYPPAMFGRLFFWWRRRHPTVDFRESMLLPAPTEEGRRQARQNTIERLRGAVRPADRVLSLEGRLWLLRLPPSVQPKTLCRDYPRVANRLASHWPDELMTDVTFDDLLVDRRGGRRGFPETVLAELRRLRHFSVRYRHLIDVHTRTEVSNADAPTLPMPLDAPESRIDWTPTEVIVAAR